ncbi:hypothetical protein [Bradyrhizobium tunisiense]|uniref:hypothetical protein n=1 Tax=Bradyrhizobium tunisiense TaxID=3278709 RepID=UPI0035E14586
MTNSDFHRSAESADQTENPFGRQRQVVRVDISGDLRDVEYYMAILRKAAERSGDDTQRMGNQFKIYPRANND